MAYESIPIEKINFNGPIDMGTNIMFGYLSDTDRIVDANNVKKQFRFDCGALTAGTLRTYTAPDASGTIALTSDISYPVTSVFGRTGAVVAAQNDYTFAQLASKPTTLSGYGITDAQGLDSDLTTIAGLTATTDNFIVSVASAWASRTPAQVKTTLALVIGTDVQAYNANIQAHIANNTQAHSDYLLNTGDTASGNYAFDTDTLYIDATNNRVGIGTAGPAARFSIGTLGTLAVPTYNTIEQAQMQMYDASSDNSKRYFDIASIGAQNGTAGGGVLRFITNPNNSNNGAERMRIERDGNVLITGYTQLGTTAQGAPVIKMKKLTGTTNAAEGGANSITHGLTSTKIIGIQVMVEYSSGSYIPSNYTTSAGYQYDWNVDATNIIVANHGTNSENILSKPIKVLITYEE